MNLDNLFHLSHTCNSRDIIRLKDTDPRQKILGANRLKNNIDTDTNFFEPALHVLFYVVYLFRKLHIFNTSLRCKHFSHYTQF